MVVCIHTYADKPHNYVNSARAWQVVTKFAQEITGNRFIVRTYSLTPTQVIVSTAKASGTSCNMCSSLIIPKCKNANPRSNINHYCWWICLLAGQCNHSVYVSERRRYILSLPEWGTMGNKYGLPKRVLHPDESCASLSHLILKSST